MHQIARPAWFVGLTLNAFFATVFAGSSVGLAAGGLSINGTPSKSATVGHAWTFTPSVSGAAATTLRFSIANKPTWASFNTATGALGGTPSKPNVGSYSNIDISASDGTTKVALPAFAVTVTQIGSKAATLSWSAPTTNSDRSALTNLAGYRIYFGTSSTSLTNSITVSSVGITSYVIGNLNPGTYYFAIMAYSTAGVRSRLSNIVSHVG